jgi:hypothetical protein
MPSYCDLFLYCIYYPFKTGMTDMSQSFHNPVLANIMVESVLLLLPEMWHRKSGHRFCTLVCLKFLGTLLYAYLSYTQSGAEKVICQSWQLAWHCYLGWSWCNISWATLTRLWLYSHHCIAFLTALSEICFPVKYHYSLHCVVKLPIVYHVGSVHNRILHSKVESSFSDTDSTQFT